MTIKIKIEITDGEESYCAQTNYKEESVTFSCEGKLGKWIDTNLIVDALQKIEDAIHPDINKGG